MSHTIQTFFRHTLDLPTSRALSFSRARSASGRFFVFSTAKRARERENYRGTRNEKRRTLRKSRDTLNSTAKISLWFRRSNTSCISYSVWYINAWRHLLIPLQFEHFHARCRKKFNFWNKILLFIGSHRESNTKIPINI